MIPASILVILLMIFFWINIPSVIGPLVNWMVKQNIRPSVAWFSAAAILILVITGAFICGVVVLISRLEDRYLKKHQPPADPAGGSYNEIDDILSSVEQSLARIRESSEKMKAQTEQIIELNRRFFAGFIVPPGDALREGRSPEFRDSRHEVSPHGRVIPDRLIGSTDIYVPGGSGGAFPKGENSRYHRDGSPEKSPEFIAIIEKITCLLRHSIKK
jgi:hypothetical protein